MNHEERLEVMAEAVKHAIAYTLIVGFLGLCYVAVLGAVDLNSPTVAGFMGTVIGAVGARIEPTIVSYFGARMLKREKGEG